MSTKPGATSRPEASISVAAVGTSPIATMRSPAMPTIGGDRRPTGAVDHAAVPDRDVDAHAAPRASRWQPRRPARPRPRRPRRARARRRRSPSRRARPRARTQDRARAGSRSLHRPPTGDGSGRHGEASAPPSASAGHRSRPRRRRSCSGTVRRAGRPRARRAGGDGGPTGSSGSRARPRTRYSRSYASPPRRSPAPPESGTRRYWTISSGRSLSSSSIGWFERLASGFETPSSPSRVARAPQAPTMTSVVPKGRRCSS